MEEEEDGDHLYTVKGRRQGRRKRGKKITRYKYNKGKESQKGEEEEKDDNKVEEEEETEKKEEGEEEKRYRWERRTKIVKE